MALPYRKTDELHELIVISSNTLSNIYSLMSTSNELLSSSIVKVEHLSFEDKT